VSAPNATLKSFDGLPFTISASTSHLCLHAREIGTSSVEFIAWFRGENRHAAVRLEFSRCISARLLAIGGESGQGMGEVLDSRWLAEANQYQRKYYPAHPDNFKDMRHYFLQGHDTSVEVLAEGFTWKEIGEVAFS